MKLHKLISRTVLATALLGATFGGVFSSINVLADINNGNGDPGKIDMTRRVKESVKGTNSTTANGSVPNGFLTLDSVPNLQFGNTGKYATDSQSNTLLNLNDSNNGILKVTDYRNIDKKDADISSQKNGWDLGATVTQFTNDHNKASSSNGWKITLNNNSNNYSNTDPFDTQKTSAPSVNSNVGLNDDSNRVSILNTESNVNNGSGYGVNKLTYNSPNSANLEVPNVPQGTYSATINWDLSTRLESYNNDWQ